MPAIFYICSIHHPFNWDEKSHHPLVSYSKSYKSLLNSINDLALISVFSHDLYKIIFTIVQNDLIKSTSFSTMANFIVKLISNHST